MTSLRISGSTVLLGVGVVFMLVSGLYADLTGNMRPASVVHKVDGRIYLSMGHLEGLTGNWMVSRLPNNLSTPHVPLTWIGDDLCRIEPAAFIYEQIVVGDTVWLTEVRLPDTERTGTSVKLAVTKLPVSTDETPVTWNDWDFREAVYTHLGETVDSLLEDESGNSVWFLWPEAEVRFSNGKVLRADAIGESLRRLCSNWDPFSVWIEHFRHIDDTLVVARTNEFTFETNFASRCGRRLSFIDSPGFYAVDMTDTGGIAERYGFGAGAYEISDITASTLTLVKRSAYYDLNAIDTIFYDAHDSYDDAKLAFELGEVDILEIAPFDVRKFEDSYEIISHKLDAAAFLSVNNQKPYFSNNLFATALNYLIDIESLCRVPLDRMVSPINVSALACDSSLTATFSYDRRKGRKLLQQIDDLPEFMSLLLTDADDVALVRTAEFIRGTLERENIHLTIYTTPFTSDTSKVNDIFRSFDLMLARLDNPAGLDAQLLYQSYFHGGVENLQWNRSLYYTTELDELFERYYTSCFDNSVAGRNMYRRIVASHLHAPSGVWLYRPVRYLAVSPRVLSVEFGESGIIDLRRIEVEQQ
ncbi:MAG: ABC transporter substrate-binding protein [Candidatus Zixiibacteriota bacterium]